MYKDACRQHLFTLLVQAAFDVVFSRALGCVIGVHTALCRNNLPRSSSILTTLY